MDITPLLGQSILERNKGNHRKSLELLSQAESIDYVDYRICENRYKVLFFMGDYDAAFRNLIVLVHGFVVKNVIQNDLFGMGQGIAQSEMQYFNSTKKDLHNGFQFDPSLIKRAIDSYPKLINVVYAGNAETYRIGHSYVGSFLDAGILSEDKHRDEWMTNYEKRITNSGGGPSYFTEGLKSYFCSIGFIYFHMNFNSKYSTPKDVRNYYLGDNFVIRKDIWNYDTFL
ncbi:hypothetical protein GYB22_04475 [bacterium]|nr:hypothetical protein [bacterium]